MCPRDNCSNRIPHKNQQNKPTWLNRVAVPHRETTNATHPPITQPPLLSSNCVNTQRTGQNLSTSTTCTKQPRQINQSKMHLPNKGCAEHSHSPDMPQPTPSAEHQTRPQTHYKKTIGRGPHLSQADRGSCGKEGRCTQLTEFLNKKVYYNPVNIT